MTLMLAEALRLRSPCTVAFIGSGGKTTAIFQLARQIKSRTVVTATSHLGVWQIPMADSHIIATESGALNELENTSHPVTLVTGEIDGDRTMPVRADILSRLQSYCARHHATLLVEADGSRQKPLKAWGKHEPPIPEFADIVVQIVGMQGLGKPLNGESVHRVDLFATRSRLGVGDIIDREALIRALLHPDNPWDRFPPHARRISMLNQADTSELQAAAQGMANELLNRYQSVIVSSLGQEKIFAVHEPVAAIILAAGESTRYGGLKQLLDWRGHPFVQAVTKKALEVGLSPVVVVTGARAEQVEQAVENLDVQIARNDEWKSGQASSIRAGLRRLLSPSVSFDNIGACVFLLVDQPQITSSILHALATKHAEGLFPIVAPMVIDRRANPVLFDRDTFDDLLTLEGDTGGRGIFHKHPVEYLPWHDDRLLLDVDTPEQYQRLIEDETL